MAELSVEIGVVIKDLQKGLKKAKAELAKFEKAGKESLDPLDRPGNQNPLKKGAKGFENLGKKAANVTPTLLEFNRVIQDAPFGIIGVSNNIQQLTANFGVLKQQTGSTSGALKALVAGFAGPQGVLFAVSALTSLLTVYGNELFKTSNALNKLDEATSKNIGSAKQEISTLNALLSVARDTTRTQEERQRALNKINNEYGDYLPNLDTENINTKKVTESVNQLSRAYIRQAKIRGLQDIISEKAAELAKETSEITKEIADDLARAGTSRIKTQDPRELIALGVDLDKVRQKTKEVREEIGKGIISEKVSKETLSLSDELANLEAQLQNIISEDITDKGIFSSSDKDKLKIKPKVEKVSTLEVSESLDPLINTIAQLNLTKLNLPIDSKFIPDLVKIRTQLIETKNAAGEKIKIRVDVPEGISADVSGLADEVNTSLGKIRTEQLENKLNTALTALNVFGNALRGVFQGIANQITESLGIANNILGSFVSSVLSQLAQLAAEAITNLITTQVIEAATQAARAGTSLAQIGVNKAVAQSNAVLIASNTAAAAGPAGPAVFAATLAPLLGSITAAFAGITLPAFNTGGFVGDNNIIRVNGDELVLNKLQQTRLFTQLNQSRSLVNGASSRGIVDSIVLDSTVRGNDIVLSYNRTNRKNNRGL